MKVPKRNYGCLFLGVALFGGGFLLPGTVILYVAFIEPLFSAASSRDWVETTCEIVSSEVIEESITSRTGRGEHASTGSSTAYRIEIEFSYEFDGRQFISNRYDLTNIADGYEQWRREVVSELRPGTKTTCFVNPERPSEAVIKRSSQVSYWTLLVPLAGISVGIAGLAFTRFAWKSTRTR